MGILDEINKNKPFEYKPLSLESINEWMNQIQDFTKNIPKQRTIIVSEYTNILIVCLSTPELSYSKEILKLNTYLKYYNYVINLYDIKVHHIIVKHSDMSLDECNLKKRYFIQCKENIINKIKKLYYGK